jgi:alkanesulfonate monooxygenase SsuD/methylene tetrahydromethanopterin reductase-like flavin-dependent oxidoreductase (luciferase family)
MKYGFVFPSGDARTAADLAIELEKSGWDGIFVWEPVWGVDAWVTLTACAMVTERLRLGTMLTPPSRMRPWKLASETATLDNLSAGRVILACGLGAPDVGFEAFGEVTDRRQRAELMDEALKIITGLWQGTPFAYHGKHYNIDVPADFMTKPAAPVQKPRIPIWVVGAWPGDKSMSRVAKYDGWLPTSRGDDSNFRQSKPDEVRAGKAWLAERRSGRAYDIVMEGDTSQDSDEVARTTVRAMADAGATWYIEAMWAAENHSAVVERARRGPPRID